MAVKLPFIKWRDGRPRLVHGPRERAKGFVDRDLRHAETEAWFSYEETQAFALSHLADVRASRQTKSTLKQDTTSKGNRGRPPGYSPVYREGFVYFLRSGDRIKIGFSTKPEKRLSALRTSSALGFHAIVFVPGSEWHEKRAHRVLKKHRRNGEWFDTHADVLAMMARSAIMGAVCLSGRDAGGDDDVAQIVALIAKERTEADLTG